MPNSNRRWFNCLKCPPPAIIPLFIRNPALFSGTTNNPGSLATEAIRYAHKVNNPAATQKRKTVILLVPQRAIPALSNNLS
jgi:hypothetical protein